MSILLEILKYQGDLCSIGYYVTRQGENIKLIFHYPGVGSQEIQGNGIKAEKIKDEQTIFNYLVRIPTANGMIKRDMNSPMPTKFSEYGLELFNEARSNYKDSFLKVISALDITKVSFNGLSPINQCELLNLLDLNKSNNSDNRNINEVDDSSDWAENVFEISLSEDDSLAWGEDVFETFVSEYE